MRVAFIDAADSSISDTVVFVEAAKVFCLPDEKRVVIHTVDGISFISCAEIDYEEYLEMTKNLLSYGFLDLTNNSFIYYSDL